jgi:hypothetical protein
MKTGKILSGISGEYFVAGELSRRGYVAALTLRNNADTDIVVTTDDGTKSFNIQVKTSNREKSNMWPMGSKPLETKPEWEGDFYYVFVSISSESTDNKIDYYIVPKNLANKSEEESHQMWLKGKKKSGKERMSQMRCLHIEKTIPNFEQYKNENGWLKLKEILNKK